MNTWKITPLGELCDVLDSKRKPVTKKNRISGKFPYYGATGILDYVDQYIFDEKLILVGEDGAKWGAGDNSAFSVEGKCWVNNHAHVIRPKRRHILDDWLVYYLNSVDLSAFITGLTVPKLNQEKMRDIPIPLPSLAEQRRIVAILDEASVGLEAMRTNAANNLQMADTLFQYFVESRLFRSGDQSQWEWGRVEDVAAREDGSIRTGPFGSQLLHGEFVEQGVAVLGIDNAVGNEFRWDRRRYITDEKFKKLSRFRVKPDDVIITIMGTCGRCAVIPMDIPVAINSKHLCCITLDKRKCLPQYLHAYFLHHPAATEFLNRKAKGSVMPGLNMGIIKELPLHLPSIDTQCSIVSRFTEFSAEISSVKRVYTRKLAAIAELKQILLQKAFSGQLTSTQSLAA
jgi:type I restriction enzyme, S subunit